MHNMPHSEEAKAKIRMARLGKPAPWKRRETLLEGGVTKYRCGRCKAFFSFDGFYKTSRTLLGIKSDCKRCHVSTSISSRNVDLARSTNQAYMARARAADPETFRARERAASRGRVKDEKVAARSALNSAVKRGYLTKPKACEVCGLVKQLNGHHDDYTKPLMVKWLCYGCHGKEHRVIEFKVIK